MDIVELEILDEKITKKVTEKKNLNKEENNFIKRYFN